MESKINKILRTLGFQKKQILVADKLSKLSNEDNIENLIEEAIKNISSNDKDYVTLKIKNNIDNNIHDEEVIKIKEIKKYFFNCLYENIGYSKENFIKEFKSNKHKNFKLIKKNDNWIIKSPNNKINMDFNNDKELIIECSKSQEEKIKRLERSNKNVLI